MCAISPAPGVYASPTIPRQSFIDIEKLYNLTNKNRAEHGDQPLSLDPLLCQIAFGHSQEMAERSYFDHISPPPGSTSPMDRYLAALRQRPYFVDLGENIYFRSRTESPDQSAAEAENAFMHSPGHRANILQASYTQMGIGIYRNPYTGAFWVTEMFLRDAE